MSLVSIRSSGSLASAASSVRCFAVSLLEAAFLIGFPLMPGRLSRADNTTEFVAIRRACLRPGMHHEDSDRSDKADGLPPLIDRGRIQPRDCERILEHQP